MGTKNVGSTVMIVIGSIFLAVTVLLGGIFCLLGTVFGVTFGEKNKLEDLKQNGAYAVGYVIDTSSEDNYTAVEFCDSNDNFYEVAFSIYSSNVQEGDYVDVYYDPYNPDDCVVEELSSVGKFIGNIFLIVGIVIGVLFGGVGAGLLIGGIVMRKKSKKQIPMQGRPQGPMYY